MTATMYRYPGNTPELADFVQKLDDAYERHLHHQAENERYRPPVQRFALSALYRLIGPQPHEAVAEVAGLHRRQMARAHAEGSVTELLADRLAVAFNLHPCLVWPEWFTGETYGDELADAFDSESGWS